ncbi:MAG: hypothetical protein MHMPM18_004897 [Marteilia pararefringens]
MLLLLHMPPHQLSRRTALFRPNRNQRYLPPTRAIPLRTGKGESGLIPVTTNANSIHFGKWFAKGFFVPDELATSIGEQRHECLAELLNDDVNSNICFKHSITYIVRVLPLLRLLNVLSLHKSRNIF